MSSNARSLHAKQRRDAPVGSWQSSAPWVAPLLTAGVLALATLVMYANCGAALI